MRKDYDAVNGTLTEQGNQNKDEPVTRFILVLFPCFDRCMDSHRAIGVDLIASLGKDGFSNFFCEYRSRVRH